MLIGNAGKSAELRYLANGTAIASFSVATSQSRKKDDKWEEETTWFNIVCWSELAERVSQNVVKGKQVYVEGRIQVRKWESDDGQKHERTEVVANSVLVLGKKDREGTQEAAVGPDDLPWE